MKSIASILTFLLLQPFLGVIAVYYDGTYVISTVEDASGNPVNIPSGNFRISLDRTDSSGSNYQFGLKVGNLVAGTMTIDGNTLSVGNFRATTIPFPQEIEQFETTLTEMLPSCDTISLLELQSQVNIVTILGPQGKIVAQNDRV
jgi:hypothetical protein